MVRLFTVSAGALLLAVGIALNISNGANAGVVPLYDPLFRMSMPMMFRIVGTVALAIGLICLFGRETRPKLVIVLWLALNLLTYQFVLSWTVAPRSFEGYWGAFAEAFDIPSSVAELILKILFFYLLAGSSAMLIWLWLQKTSVENDGSFKIFCHCCGGKIKFSETNEGRQIACPHCHSTVSLQRPVDLRMTCILCGGHIEFPAYALGQKIQCPHCAKNITLLNPT